ncbi:MAG: oxidoreductase, partial [Alphaproteobacteria bacterium]|nr:oxidoreductase [Alphaproteobacteria bacterium]
MAPRRFAFGEKIASAGVNESLREKPMSGAPALFTPLQIGPVEVANRIAVSPMCQYSATGGSASDWHVQHVMRLSLSGAGLAVLEVTGVTPEGRISPGCLGLYSDANEQALARVIAAMRPWAMPGFKLGIQIGHAGRKGSTPLAWDRGAALTEEKGGWETVGPSAITFSEGVPPPRELSHNEIISLIDAFASSARRAVRAGFDLVEVHAAHGYLIHQFHSPISNKRNDAWGGDEKRRLAFPLAVAEAVRAAVASHIALGARITSTDFLEGGLGVEDAVILA